MNSKLILFCTEILFKNKLLIFIAYFIISMPIIFIFYDFGFISDDYYLIKKSIDIKNIYDLFFTSISQRNLYRPIILLSFFINYKINELESFGYYLFNLISHLLVGYFLLLLLDKIKDKLKITNGFIFFAILYFLSLPQNIANVFWISGRTDILSYLFLVMSIYSSLFYIMNNTKKSILLFNIFLLLALLSKETAVIVVFYLLFIHLLFKDSKSKIVLFNGIFFVVFYISIYFLMKSNSITNNLVGNIHYLSILKSLIYTILSYLLVIDIKDLFFLFQKEISLFFILFFIYLLFYTYLFFKVIKLRKKLESYLILLGIFSTSIYLLVAFPEFRLMYSHIFFLILFIFSTIKESKNSIKIFLIIFIFLLNILGCYFVIKSYCQINEYNKNLINAIKKEKKNYHLNHYVLIPTLLNVSQRFAMPFIEIKSNFALNNSLFNVNNNFTDNVLFLESYSLNNIFKSVSYKKIDSLSFLVETENPSNLIIEPKNLIYKKSPYFIVQGLNKIKYFDNRYDKILIRIREDYDKLNLKIIYIDNNKIHIKNMRNFINELK